MPRSYQAPYHVINSPGTECFTWSTGVTLTVWPWHIVIRNKRPTYSPKVQIELQCYLISFSESCSGSLWYWVEFKLLDSQNNLYINTTFAKVNSGNSQFVYDQAQATTTHGSTPRFYTQVGVRFLSQNRVALSKVRHVGYNATQNISHKAILRREDEIFRTWWWYMYIKPQGV